MSDAFEMPGGEKQLNDAVGGFFEFIIEQESSFSQNAAQDEVNAEMRSRRSEINNLRRQYPKNSIYVHIFAMIEKNSAEGPKLWKFGSIIVSMSRHANAGMIPGSGRIFHKVIVMPPLGQSAIPSNSPTVPAWELRYNGAFLTALLTDGSEEAALAVLNGSSMYDLLRMLKKLALDGKYFNRLYSLAGSSQGIGRSRLLVAFAAVMASWKSSDALNILQERMGEVAKLPPEQQRDILEFLGDGTPSDVTKAITGKWRVKVGRWTWIYTFDAKHNVSWLDQGNGRSGHGRWKEDGSRIKTSWAPSKTIEYWNFSIASSSQTGIAMMAEGTFDLTAEKL